MAIHLCQSDVVKEREAGFPFRVIKAGRLWPAFAIRFNGEVKGYLNVCAHVGLRLNGGSGQFFSRDRQQLVCSSHGATYRPDTGLCVDGPCTGLNLISLNLVERNGSVYFADEEYAHYE